MAATEDSVFDQYRGRVEQPLGRLFRKYGVPEWPYFAVGMVANVVARVASLLPPVVLGAAIDSVFTGDAPYDLPLVPATWFPTSEAAQFELSAALIAGSFVVTAVFTYLYGVAANLFAHRVMHEVRTDSFAKMQSLDMTFFDDKQTGEVMSVLNNVHESEALVQPIRNRRFLRTTPRTSRCSSTTRSRTPRGWP